MSSIATSIVICLAAFACSLWLLRRDKLSFGFPVSYLAYTVINHVPGAYANLDSRLSLDHVFFTEIGIRLTAIGMVCFVGGVWLAGLHTPAVQVRHVKDNPKFWFFCVAGGLFVQIFVYKLLYATSLSNAANTGSMIWILGAILGLQSALRRRNFKSLMIWLVASAIFPLIALVGAGFLSFGVIALITVFSALAISTPSPWRVAIAIPLIGFLGMNVFGVWMQQRATIRDTAWNARSGYAQKLETTLSLVRDFKPFDPSDPLVLSGLDARLNQNYFVGLGAYRIQVGERPYLGGKTIKDALLAMIPRALWPDKPKFGGSGDIVVEATGAELSQNASWGVGNIMEFQINFGLPGLIVGMFSLGWLIRTVDRKAALAYARGDLGATMLYFLPAVGLMGPLGALSEMTGNAAAGLVTAYGWKFAWERWVEPAILQRPGSKSLTHEA